MFSMAINAQQPGLVIDLPYRWRRESYPPIREWVKPSQALVSAFRKDLRSESFSSAK